MNDLQEKFFCPRLIDYIGIVGSYSPLAKHSSESSISQPDLCDNNCISSSQEQCDRSNSLPSDAKKPSLFRSSTLIGSISSANTSSISHIQNPDLLRRYPVEDHSDFPLPKDIVCFCQPEGCITTAGRLSDSNKVSSFIFTISDKDTVRTRYGVCVNFYRPVKQKLKRSRSRNQGSADYSSSDTSPSRSDAVIQGPYQSELDNDNINHTKIANIRRKSFRGSFYKPRQKVQYNTLTSLCLISHHPFFMAFRECLFYLKSLVDVCNESVTKVPDCHRRKSSIWDILIHKLQVETPIVRHYIKEIEKWMLRLLSVPVPVPGKTRVELELYASKDNSPPLIFALPDHTRFSLLDFPLHLPLELLGIETCMHVLTLILLERKVVFQSRDYNALTMSVLAFIALIYPLEYMFPVIPLLPISLEHSECLLDNPTPYVVGIPINFFVLKKHFTLPDDIWLIDLDTNKIVSPEKSRPIPQIPQPDGTILKNQLRQAINRLSVPLASSGLTLSDTRSNNDTNSTCSMESTKNKTLDYKQRTDSTSNIQKELQTLGDPTMAAYPYDVDSVDIAVRVAMVRFLNSGNILANLAEHTRTIRLFPRPVVTVQTKSFIQSRTEVTHFIEELARTQAVEYFAESSLMPANVVFQRIHTNVMDVTLIGDKSKWFAHTLEPVTFSVWSKSSFLENIFKQGKRVDDRETDTDIEDNSLSPVSSASENDDISSPDQGSELLCYEDVTETVYDPPCNLQIPYTLESAESPMLSSTTSASTESDLNSPEFQPSSLVNTEIINVIIPQSKQNCSNTRNNIKLINRFKSLRNRDSDSFWTSMRKKSSQEDEDDDDVDNDNDDDDTINAFTQLSKRRMNQEGLLAQMDKITVHAKKAAGEASKSMQEVSKSAFEASKTAAGVSRSTFEDLTYVGKNTLGDLTKSAKQVASKTRFLKVGLLSDFSSNERRSLNAENRSNQSDPNRSPTNKILAEKSPLIRHSSPKRSEISKSQYNDKSLNSADNQAFLKDIAHQILEGESVGWLKINRCKKLLEEESNRCLLLSKLNRTLDSRINPTDYVDDVYINKIMWKSMLKILQAAIHGLETSFAHSSTGGMASVFHVLEIAHTHYWSKSGDSYASELDSQLSSPFGSREDLHSPTSPSDASTQSHSSSRNASDANTSNDGSNPISSSVKSLQRTLTKEVSDVLEVSNISSAADILRDLFNKKKESFTARSPSIDNECLTDTSLRMSPESGNVSETGSMVTNPSYVLQRMHKNSASFRSTVSDSEIEHTSVSKNAKGHVPTAWSSKSSLSAGFRYHGGAIHNTLGFNSSDTGRMYLYEGLVGKDRSSLWDKMEFWEEAFIDAVSHERDIVGMDQGLEEMIDRYKHLSEDEQRRLAHDEDRLLSTMLYNLTAFMIMMKVKKEAINSKVRSMLGKCRVAICYAEEINTLLGGLNTLEKNEVDLRCVASRLGHGQSFAVHIGTDSSGILLFVEVRDDGLVMRTVNGTVYERWWYERVINMTYSPKNKVLCLWKKVGGQTSLHKYYTKKSKQLYYCIKSSMERAVAQGQHVGQTVELGGEFPVKDLNTGEGGLLQVCMEGVGLLFCGSKFFVKLKRIRKCFTVKGKYFVLEEYNPKTRSITQRKYESSLAAQICYSVLCVFSYAAAVHHHKCKPQSLTPDTHKSVELATLP